MTPLLQEIYDSEINFIVSSFWDCGFAVKLGDPMNGYRAEAQLDTWAEVEAWLCRAVLTHFPDSVFSRRHRERDDLPPAPAAPAIPRGKYLGRRAGGEPADEAEHFIRCGVCGGLVDCRDLGSVMAHEGPLPHPAGDGAQ